MPERLVFIGMQNLVSWVNCLTLQLSPDPHFYWFFLISESAFEVHCVICPSHLMLTHTGLHCWSVKCLCPCLIFKGLLRIWRKKVVAKQRYLVSWAGNRLWSSFHTSSNTNWYKYKASIVCSFFHWNCTYRLPIPLLCDVYSPAIFSQY